MSGQAKYDHSEHAVVGSLDDVVEELRRVLAGIRHGSVTLIVQDGHVIQIDATRKVRLGTPKTPLPGAQRER